jgi:hypothetical protein
MGRKFPNADGKTAYALPGLETSRSYVGVEDDGENCHCEIG